MLYDYLYTCLRHLESRKEGAGVSFDLIPVGGGDPDFIVLCRNQHGIKGL
jgi:hypothetical protein